MFRGYVALRDDALRWSVRRKEKLPMHSSTLASKIPAINWQAQMALEALKDLFINNLLPDGRKLVSFKSRPLQQAVEVVEVSARKGGSETSGASATNVGRAMLLWYFEDQVRGKGGCIIGWTGRRVG